jgi:uncharacterized membrane protein YeiB
MFANPSRGRSDYFCDMSGALTIAAQGRALFGWPSLGRADEAIERLGGVMLALGYAAAVIGLKSVPAGQWLGRYRHGPVEWLWRSQMYSTWQPMVQRWP